MKDTLKRLRYPVQHAVISCGISAVGYFAAQGADLPLWYGVIAGPVAYTAREVNQWLAGKLGYSWPGNLTWLLGRPADRFDVPGLAGGLVPLIGLALVL